MGVTLLHPTDCRKEGQSEVRPGSWKEGQPPPHPPPLDLAVPPQAPFWFLGPSSGLSPTRGCPYEDLGLGLRSSHLCLAEC